MECVTTWMYIGSLWPFEATLEQYWGELRACLRPSWAILELSGASLGYLELSGAFLGLLGAFLGPTSCLLKAFLGYLGAKWWPVNRGSKSTLVHRLRAFLGMSWAILGSQAFNHDYSPIRVYSVGVLADVGKGIGSGGPPILVAPVLGAGCWVLCGRFWLPRCWVLGAGCPVPGAGCWVLV